MATPSMGTAAPHSARWAECSHLQCICVLCDGMQNLCEAGICMRWNRQDLPHSHLNAGKLLEPVGFTWRFAVMSV